MSQSKNGFRQRKSRSKMSILELQTGLTPEQYEAWHRQQRENVRARFLNKKPAKKP